MRYIGNPKHSDPWQPGKRGSLCPKEVKPHAQELLDGSIPYGNQRYAIFNGVPYEGQSDNSGEDWHGYPVGIAKVPEDVLKTWLESGSITNKMIKKLRKS